MNIDNIKKCSKCDKLPCIQNDELGFTYRFICDGCGKHTQDLLSPSSSLDDPHCDEETTLRLIDEWNSMN